MKEAIEQQAIEQEAIEQLPFVVSDICSSAYICRQCLAQGWQIFFNYFFFNLLLIIKEDFHFKQQSSLIFSNILCCELRWMSLALTILIKKNQHIFMYWCI